MNAPRPLRLSSYDGSGQNVHPDVLRVRGGFAGHEYWMAITPYPYCRDRLENPALRASDDGCTWFLPVGVPDPIVPPPADPDAHHADADIVVADGVMHMVYITTNEFDRRTQFSVVRSRDARTWAPPVVIHDEQWGVSPAMVVRDETWHLWYVDYDSDADATRSRVRLRTGRQLEALGEPADCMLEIPGHVAWHLDVIDTPEGFEALIAAFRVGAPSSRCRLFHAASTDGRHWRLSADSPVLTPSWLGWDNRVVYRATMLKDGRDAYRVWYTGGSWGKVWGVGALEGGMRRLRPAAGDLAEPAPSGARLIADTVGATRYGIGRLLSRTLVRRMRSWRRGR